MVVITIAIVKENAQKKHDFIGEKHIYWYEGCLYSESEKELLARWESWLCCFYEECAHEWYEQQVEYFYNIVEIDGILPCAYYENSVF